MPRSACYTCRSSKVRCKAHKDDVGCERCIARKLQCSYVSKPQRPSPSDMASKSSWHSSEPVRSDSSPQTPQFSQNYRLEHETLGLDFGRGRPEDILREGEFTHSLILLYFSNFSDIHFMFDEELFLADFATSQVPKLILYSITALSIRFSMAPFAEELPPCHRGELLFQHARKLLLDDFDWPSVPAIQTYVLLSTYKLALGGSRQAYVYLGFAANMLRALRLMDISTGEASVSSETHRRLVCTMVLMDRLISLPLRLTPHFSGRDSIPTMLQDDDFSALKRGRANQATHSQTRAASISREIMVLSEILAELYNVYLEGDMEVSEIESRFNQYSAARHPSLLWTSSNVSHHLQRDTLRQFSYMHLLYHHIGQLVYFKALKSTVGQPREQSSSGYSSAECHRHSSHIAGIVQTLWGKAGFDLHNFSIGKILTIAVVVHAHALLVAPTNEAADHIHNQIAIMTTCIHRMKNHTRMFIWVHQHLETFKNIFTQDTSVWARIFDDNSRLLRQMMYLGSYYEKFDPRTAGHRIGIEALLEQ